MIRLPNPGSDFNQMINIFKILYSEFADYSSFNIDNMAQIMTAKNVASSNGYIGKEALTRSYSVKDKSRNGIYNQAKSYSEVFRAFGWINSVEESSSQFIFTYFGKHVSQAVVYKNIIIESLINLHYPNDLINVRFSNKSYLFATLLKYISDLDNFICRDEIILGLMNLTDDNDYIEYKNSVESIKNLRKTNDFEKFKNALKKVRNQNNISESTSQNYTRLIIAALKYTGWVEEKRKKVYGKSMVFYELTNEGKSFIHTFSSKKLIKKEDLLNLTTEKIKSLSRTGFYELLQRCDFNVDVTIDELEEDKNIVLNLFDREVIFNPFQHFSYNDISLYFPEVINDQVISSVKAFEIDPTTLKNDLIGMNNNNSLIRLQERNVKFKKSKLFYHYFALLQNSDDIDSITEGLYENVAQMKQNEFYPLIADLFVIIFGLESRAAQAGNNNERHDVIIIDEKYSIPVEVKSPTEEKMLSVKAIRQAIENKIILLSRKAYPTLFQTASFAIGYNIPNKRSDVYRLISDINNVFNLNIAILDVKTLIYTALKCIQDDKQYKIESFNNYFGVINFEDI
ncbi:hypothetical protein NGH30_07315 [Macrococcus caseolyticus]|uniref:hypothetical protein n=1 Tax=Macrococcoides caseolyticum TaxID=69966 RepID=UPI002DBBEEEF|nr:hypothetical protein [Macrococcus caseolyticus]MEB8171643.1 hypothetical protein [Macrococcus caseolyticus]